jgi:hypothetical protein
LWSVQLARGEANPPGIFVRGDLAHIRRRHIGSRYTRQAKWMEKVV